MQQGTILPILFARSFSPLCSAQLVLVRAGQHLSVRIGGTVPFLDSPLFRPGGCVPSTTPLIDKLLTTIIQLKASDLHIAVGQPPVIRHHGRLRRLETKLLDSDDTTALMKAITPDRI